MRLLRILILVVAAAGVFANANAEETPTAAYLAAQKLPLPAQFEFHQQRFIKGLPRPLSSSGVLNIQADMIEWHTQQPVPQHLTISATGIVDTSNDETLRGGEVIANILLAVLSGDAQSIQQHFNIALHNDCAELSPRDATLSQFVAQINTCGVGQLERIELHETNGNRSVISLHPHASDTSQSE